MSEYGKKVIHDRFICEKTYYNQSIIVMWNKVFIVTKYLEQCSTVSSYMWECIFKRGNTGSQQTEKKIGQIVKGGKKEEEKSWSETKRPNDD